MNRDAAIEAGARAEHSSELETGYQNSAWSDLDDDTRAWYRRNAAAVIDAAVPHIVDEVLALANEADAKGAVLQGVPELRLVGSAYRGMAERIRFAVGVPPVEDRHVL